MMNFFSIPVLYGFYMVPALEVFGEPAPQNVQTERESSPNDGYVSLEDCWLGFEAFIESIDQNEQQASSIRYMDLVDKPALRTVPGFSDFREIYCGGLER